MSTHVSSSSGERRSPSDAGSAASSCAAGGGGPPDARRSDEPHRELQGGPERPREARGEDVGGEVVGDRQPLVGFRRAERPPGSLPPPPPRSGRGTWDAAREGADRRVLARAVRTKSDGPPSHSATSVARRRVLGVRVVEEPDLAELRRRGHVPWPQKSSRAPRRAPRDAAVRHARCERPHGRRSRHCLNTVEREPCSVLVQLERRGRSGGGAGRFPPRSRPAALRRRAPARASCAGEAPGHRGPAAPPPRRTASSPPRSRALQGDRRSPRAATGSARWRASVKNFEGVSPQFADATFGVGTSRELRSAAVRRRVLEDALRPSRTAQDTREPRMRLDFWPTVEACRRFRWLARR